MIKNKKGFLLVEAVLSMGILMLLLASMTYVYVKQTDFETRINYVLSQNAYKSLKNNINYIKERTESYWDEEKYNYLLNNIKYPWWTELKVTSGSTESLNDLNGTYHLTSINCPVGLKKCLKKDLTDSFLGLPLWSWFITYNEDVNWEITLKEKWKVLISDQTLLCEDEFTKDCLWYKIIITNQTTAKSANLNYLESDWTNRIIRTKNIKFVINSGKEKEYSYILSQF